MQHHDACTMCLQCRRRKEDCLFVVLYPSNIKVTSGRVPTCDRAHSWQLSQCCPTGTTGCQHHDLISHSSDIILTLIWVFQDTQNQMYIGTSCYQQAFFKGYVSLLTLRNYLCIIVDGRIRVTKGKFVLFNDASRAH